MLGDVVEAALAGRTRPRRHRRLRRSFLADAEVVADPGRGLGAAVEAGLLQSRATRSSSTPIFPRPRRRLSLGSPTRHSRSWRRGTARRTRCRCPIRRIFAPLYGPRSADRFRAHAPFVTARSRSSRQMSTPRRTSSGSPACSGLGRARCSPSTREGRSALGRRRRRALRARPPVDSRSRGADGHRQRRRRPRDPRAPRAPRPRQPALHPRGPDRRGSRLGTRRRDVERARVGGGMGRR